MVSVRNCSGCEHFEVDESGMRCTFMGLCAYRTSRDKPFGYRTPEDMMQAPERRKDARGLL